MVSDKKDPLDGTYCILKYICRKNLQINDKKLKILHSLSLEAAALAVLNGTRYANKTTKVRMPNLSFINKGAMRTPKVINKGFSLVIVLQHCSTKKKQVSHLNQLMSTSESEQPFQLDVIPVSKIKRLVLDKATNNQLQFPGAYGRQRYRENMVHTSESRKAKRIVKPRV